MTSVYDTNAFQKRVDFAAAVILRGGNTTRNFDTCFEMSDGREVAEALLRRSFKNRKIAERIWKYLSKDLVLEQHEQYKSMTDAELRRAAQASRDAWQRHMAETYPDRYTA